MHANYAEFLRAARKAAADRYPSQGALADAFPQGFGVYQTRISEWERGDAVPDRAQAAEIVRLLELTDEQAKEADALLLAFEVEKKKARADAADADDAAA